MIKKSRLLLFSVFAIVASILLTSNVFAFKVGEYIGHDYYNTPIITTSGAVKGTGYSTYSMYSHYTNYNGGKYTIYCLDPARKSGGKNANLYVQRVLDQNNPKDAVILAIISDSGYNAIEKTMALRAFIPLNHDLSRNQTITSYEKYEGYANANSGIKWAAEEKEATKAIFGISNPTTSSVYKIAYSYSKYDKNVILNENNYYVKEAKKLFKKALKYGAKIANGQKVTNKSVTYTKPVVDEDKYEVITENGVKKSIGEITFTATFAKFNDGTTDPVKVVINPDTKGAVAAISYEYQVLGTDNWVEFDSNTDFKPLLDKDSVVINFRVKAKTNTVTDTDITINFHVEAKYNDEDVLTGALLYNKKKSSTQRFYIYDKEPAKTSSIDEPIKWRDEVVYCTNIVPDKNNTDEFKKYMNECCRGNNESGFNVTTECQNELSKAKTEEEKQEILKNNKYCQLKAEYCDYCNSTVTVPKTCSEFSEGEFEKGLTAKINGPEDIKVCVMDGTDEANQSYVLSKNVTVNDNSNYSFKDNKYCHVSCKEDYEFDLPTGRYVISGRYFTLKMGVNATKTCYTDLINYDAFEKDIKEYEGQLNSYIASGNTSVANTEFVNAYNNYKKAITDIQACSLGWDNKYNVDPEISFDYNEEYIEKYLGGENGLKFVVGEDKKTTETKWFCNGSDVDKKYNNCIGATATSEAKTTTENVIECSTTNAVNYNCKTVQKEIPTTKYAKVTTNVNASYAPESIFYTKYSTGVIEVNKEGNKKYTKLDAYLDSKIDDSIKIKSGALPVSLKDGKGVYNYNIKFNNVGEYFDNDSFGRLIGGKSSVALVNNDTTFMGTYVCSYVVNCPECKVSCVEDPKNGIFCKLGNDNSDPTECVGTCAFDSSVGELYSIHQTSLTNFNPTGRDLGANLTTQKGEALIDSITSKGEDIYKNPEYSFVFTPAVISFLRSEINAKSDNGYLGEPTADYDMYCKLYSEIKGDSSIAGTDKDYTICNSAVLDALEDKFNAVKVHPLEDSREKITSWLQSDYCKDDKNACALVGAVGPAWK